MANLENLLLIPLVELQPKMFTFNFWKIAGKVPARKKY
jgi:hypothetical protein